MCVNNNDNIYSLLSLFFSIKEYPQACPFKLDTERPAKSTPSTFWQPANKIASSGSALSALVRRHAYYSARLFSISNLRFTYLPARLLFHLLLRLSQKHLFHLHIPPSPSTTKLKCFTEETCRVFVTLAHSLIGSSEVPRVPRVQLTRDNIHNNHY